MIKQSLKVPISGKKIKADLKEIEIVKLRYDQFNPRISLARDTHMGTLYKKEFPQDHIELALKGTPSFQELKISMMKGGGAMNPLWVFPEGDHFIVVEGNTRLAAYRDILRQEPLNTSFEKVNCYVLPFKVNDETKNFIRLTAHLHGQEDWDKYEQAKYLFILYEKENYPISMLADMTKLKRSDIEQDIEAFKIMNDEFYPKYGKYDKSFVHRFSYFKEYMKDKKLQILMKSLKMDSKTFCDWVGKGKFVKAQDVRKIRDILSDKSTREVFVKKDFESAMEELRNVQPEKAIKLFKLINQSEECIKNLTVSEIDEIKKDKKKMKILVEFSKRLQNLIRS